MATEFMKGISEKMVESGLSENSVALYIRNLKTLNNKQPFTNLNFLKEYKEIENILRGYSEATQKNFISSIITTLKIVMSNYTQPKWLKKVYEYYSKTLAKFGQPTNSLYKTEKQEKNWVSWEDVLSKRKEYEEKAKVGSPKWEDVLGYMILSLYTDIPPRRNMDYQVMYVVPNGEQTGDLSKNYYVKEQGKFVFNRYKTQTKYGQQVEIVRDNEKLMEAIRTYLSHHPLRKAEAYPFLVKEDGEAITSINGMTRILNRIFNGSGSGKKIGSSMLRHIYLTERYGTKMVEMKDLAEKMGHSTATQRSYIVPEANVVVKREPVIPDNVSGGQVGDISALMEDGSGAVGGGTPEYIVESVVDAPKETRKGRKTRSKRDSVSKVISKSN